MTDPEAPTAEGKVCTKCHTWKPFAEFMRDRRRPHGRGSYCRECHRQRMKKWNRRPDVLHANKHRNRLRRRDPEVQETQRRYDKRRRSGKEYREDEARKRNRRLYLQASRQEDPQKFRSRDLLKIAVKRGDISKPTACDDCGVSGLRIDGHHEDYSLPYEVEWLCQSCHATRHRLPAGENENGRSATA